MIDQENGLPDGWNKTLISCIAQVDLGKTPKKVQYCDFSGYKIIKFRDISYNGVNWNKNDKGYIKSDTSIKDLKVLKLNDVLITASAHASEHIGKKVAFAARIPNDFEEVFYVGEILNIRAKPEALLPKFTFYYFISKEGYKAIQEKVKGVHLTTGEARKIEIPLAPLLEQHRIVAEIEKQFSRLDEAVAGLKRIQANLKRYRASVLKAAVEGKLTAEWRKQHPDTEPAEQLLQRILKVRRAHWEQAELQKIQAADKPPKDEQWKQKYKEPVSPDVSDLPVLPNGWVLASTDQLFWFVTSGSRGWAKFYANKGAIFLRVGNLNYQSINLDLKNIQRVQLPQEIEGVRTRVYKNDILVSITAAIGMIAIVPEAFEEAYINQHISLARPVSVINSFYIAWFLTSIIGQDQFRDLQRGATKVGLGLDDIRKVNISLPSIEEQKQIVSEVERRLSIADEVEQQINTSLKRAERLRQSILKKAFSGRLVPQDPNDEPVGVLLEKIKQEQRA